MLLYDCTALSELVTSGFVLKAYRGRCTSAECIDLYELIKLEVIHKPVVIFLFTKYYSMSFSL